MKYNKVWDFFEEIYCINLDERTDRWEHAKLEFEKVELADKVRRFSAIKDIDGSYGLIKSNLSIIEDVNSRNIKNVLIFEDDVNFINDTIEILTKSLEQLGKNNWSLFYLGGVMHEKCKLLSSNLVLINKAGAAHAVAYNKNVYKKIIEKYKNLDRIRDIEDVYDVFLYNNIQKTHISLMTNPMIAIQYPSYSNLVNGYVDYSTEPVGYVG